LRRSLLINEGDWWITLFHSPLAIGLAIATVVLTIASSRVRINERMQEISEDAASATEDDKGKDNA
jgi:TctA family transporter